MNYKMYNYQELVAEFPHVVNHCSTQGEYDWHRERNQVIAPVEINNIMWVSAVLVEGFETMCDAISRKTREGFIQINMRTIVLGFPATTYHFEIVGETKLVKDIINQFALVEDLPC